MRVDREEAVKWNPVFLLGLAWGWTVKEFQDGRLCGMNPEIMLKK